MLLQAWKAEKKKSSPNSSSSTILKDELLKQSSGFLVPSTYCKFELFRKFNGNVLERGEWDVKK